jgi:hypothetical protein
MPDKNDAVCVSASVSSRGVDFGFGEFEFGSVFGGAFHFEHESPRLDGDFDVVAQRVVTFDAAFDFVPVTGALRDHASAYWGWALSHSNATTFVASGCEGIILGCTEIELLLPMAEVGDSTVSDYPPARRRGR